MKRDRLLAMLVLAATVAGVASVLLAIGFQRLFSALFLHAAAAALSLRAARRSRKELTAVERDLVLTASLAIPLFGPAMAWSLPPRRVAKLERNEKKEGKETDERKEEKAAPTMFERYEEHVRPHVPEHERSIFTGNYNRDIARELDAQSYYEVLRHGQTDQKRNALRRLADLGEPRHLALVRRCLVDPDHEVRLYAYSELERLGRVHEEEIARLREATTSEESAPEDVRALAETHWRYGASGIQDDEMAAYHFRLAARHASSARARGDTEPDCFWIEAMALCRLGEYATAEELLARMDAAQACLPQTRITRAELAYRQRKFADARTEALELAAAGAKMPEWLEALGAQKEVDAS